MRRAGLMATAGVAVLALGAAPAKRPARPAAAATAPAAVGPVTGPVAEYWVSAATASGMGAGLMGGGRPSMSQVMALASGRGPSSVRTLELQLGSTQRPSGPPAADHYVPPGLGVGPSLPLATPQAAPARPAERAEPGTPESYQRPRGKILIYWGCGEHAGPGQPVVFDFSTLGVGAPLPDLGGAVRVNYERPPSEGRSATYGHWPNEKRQVQVPAAGSLVGAHDLRGDYAPEMRFEVGPELDFMPALDLAGAGATPGGGKRLTWRPAPTATGYHLMLIGAQGEPEGAGGRGRGARGGGDPTAAGATMVFWSSSAVQPGFFGGGLADYLPPGEVARLVRERAVLPPGTSECVVPSEVAQASPMGLVTAIGYGPEQVWTDPPRPRSGPWPISWRAKVRVKSTATLLLGMPSMGGDDDDGPRRGRRAGPGQAPPTGYPPPAAPTAGDAAKELLRRFRPF